MWTREVWCSPLGDTKLHESHSLVHKLKWGNREWLTHTHTHTVWWSDTSCSCIFVKKTELGFKDTTIFSMDQGCALILECKISVTWMTIVTEPLQSLFICFQVHLGGDNNSELGKLVMQHWLLDRPQLKCFFWKFCTVYRLYWWLPSHLAGRERL
jgi:hypothetical protein